jgi:opacity protein-like surface antigen
MAKYKVADSFNIQAGPQINYLLEDLPDGEFGMDIAVGAGYQFDDNWFVEARYGFEISRGGDFGEFTDINTLTAGVGYRF